jgi:8-oxo-dGTP pyrophosphatase MutT (NUDIX family)
MSSDGSFGLFSQLADGGTQPLSGIDVTLSPAPHDYAVRHQSMIEAHWQELSARNPALFNGKVILPSRLQIEAGVLTGVAHAVDFATFLHWRDHGDNGQCGMHMFAHGVLVTGENRMVTIRMAGHTVNAGKIYCPAGSFEPGDFFGGRLDFEANVAREVGEETGLVLDEATGETGYHLLRFGRFAILLRRYLFSRPAAGIALDIRRHIANETDSEITDVVMIGEQDRPTAFPPYMHALADWHFANPVAHGDGLRRGGAPAHNGE